MCLCTVDPTKIVIPVAVSAGTTIVLVPILMWLVARRQNRNYTDDERRRLLDNRPDEGEQNPIRVRNPIPDQNPIPERHPIPESSAGCAEGPSCDESNIISVSV